jgi:hypothetical protein
MSVESLAKARHRALTDEAPAHDRVRVAFRRARCFHLLCEGVAAGV